MIRYASHLALFAFLTAGCGGDGASADATGDYAVAITSGANGCNFVNWEEGATNTGIPLGIVEAEAGVTATVGGISALFLDLLVGSNVFVGGISGSELSMDIEGTVERNQDGCTHFVNSSLEANIDGDILVGSVIYTVADNDSAECAALIGCESVQNFNGTRPPQ
tara:strand:- start:2098 stop:2592 length:495 start_codon:yes stop_codon:yes gene_type:complete